MQETLCISSLVVSSLAIGCSASSSGSESPAAKPSAVDAVSVPSSSHAPTKTYERMANGLLKMMQGEFTTYLRHNCSDPDTDGPHCTSYTETDANGVVRSSDGAPSTTCSGGSGVCLGAGDLEQAYAVPTAVPGTSPIIAVLGAADSPNLESDLATYRSTYGLPACTSASGCFKKVNESGASSPLAAVDSTGNGPVSEEILDISMVSAGCPSCKILVVEMSASYQPQDIYTAIATAARLGASAVTTSFVTTEFSDETSYDNQFVALGVGLFTSTGDTGGATQTGLLQWPGVSTAFTAVGGTDLVHSSARFPNGAPRGWTETGWVQPYVQKSWGGAGWGCSAYEPKPTSFSSAGSWQVDTGCNNRTAGDVSAIAGTGVNIYFTPVGASGGWVIDFGTSVAAPFVAGLYTQAGVAHAGPGFSYAYGGTFGGGASGFNGFTDITDNFFGAIGPCPSSTPAYLCNAVGGYDSPTGNGSPNGAEIAQLSNWNNLGTTIPTDAVVAGTDGDGANLYWCRAPFKSSLQPGKTRSGWGDACDIGWGGAENWVNNAEILVTGWATGSSGAIPRGASTLGVTSGGGAMYSCRASFQGGLAVGNIGPSATGCSIPWGNVNNIVRNYQVMTNTFNVIPQASVSPFPAQAIVGGYESDNTPLYLCVAQYQGAKVPGKMHRDWTSCDIGVGSSEIFVSTYEVVVPSYNTLKFVAGVDSGGGPLGLCNVSYQGSTQVGKYLSWGACNFGFGGSEVSITSGVNALDI